MHRIAYVKIAGKKYPMSFSLMAARKITEKYGSIEKMMAYMEEGKESTRETIDAITELLELLIAQGCAYKNYFEKDVPTNSDDPIIDGKWTPLPREALEIAISIEEIEHITEKIEECIDGGKQKEIEAKEVKTVGKEEARQA